MYRALFALQLRLVLSQRRLLLLAFLLLPVALAVLLRLVNEHEQAPESGALGMAVVLFLLYPLATAGLAGLFTGSEIVGSEVESRTFTYLLTRPLGKARILLVKYAALVCGLGVGIGASMLVSWALLGAPFGMAGFLALLLSVVLALGAYNAIAIAFGLVAPKRAITLGLFYGGMVELVLGFVPSVAQTLAVQYHLRIISLGIVDPVIPTDDDAWDLLTQGSIGMSLLAVLLISAGWFVAAMVIIRFRQFTSSERS